MLGVFTLWSIVLIAWLTLHWGILPHIDEWRPQLQERASQALGLPVRIGQVGVRSAGWVPALELRDVVVADPSGAERLRLPRVDAALSPGSLLRWRLTFSQLHLDGLSLEVRRDRLGRLHVAGLDLGAAASGASGGGRAEALDWLLDQPELVLRRTQVRWVDEWRGAPPVALRDADLVLRNGLRRHELRIDATPDDGVGARFSVVGRFTQPLLADRSDWSRWSGTVYADLPAVDLSRLAAHVSLPVALQAGRGAARAWLEVGRGQWRRLTVDTALESVSVRLTPTLEPLALASLHGRLDLERSAGQLRVAADGLRFTTADGAAWPASRWQLQLSQPQPMDRVGWSERPIAGGEFSADRLDLALMAGVAERLPLPATWRRVLSELAPQGVVSGLQASWIGPPGAPARYRLKAHAHDLALAALPAPGGEGVGRPGWRGAQVELEANESGGEARLQIRDGAVELPGVFEDPVLPLDEFSGRLVWRLERPAAAAAAGPVLPAVDLRVLDARFTNADAKGALQLRWHTGDTPGRGHGRRLPGVIDLTGQIERAQAARVARYLPLQLPAATRAYVAGAVQGGTARQARLRLRGDLHDFPFARPGQQDGEFLVTARAEDVTLAYVPPVLTGGEARWPAFTQVNGELEFDRGAMRIRDARARLWGIELKGVQGEIADLAHDATLVISGGGRGPLTDALRYVASTPIEGWLSHALQQASGSGAADLQLALHIPLHDSRHTRVRGSVALAGNDVRLRPDIPPLQGVRTRIEFSEQGFSLSPGTARALGGELAFDGGLGPDGVVRFQAQGTATAEGLRQAAELGWVTRLATAARGQAPYRLQVGVQRGQTELLVSSPLTGLAIDLPPPFAKPADAAWPLRVQTQAQRTGGATEGTLPADLLQVELGTVLRAEYQREHGPQGTRVLRGALAAGSAALPAAAPGSVVVAVELPTLPAEAWWSRWQALAAPVNGRPAATGVSSADASRDEPVDGYLPTELALRAAEVQAAGRRWGALQAQVQRRGPREQPAWIAQLQGDAVQGQLEWRPAAGPAAARWQARLGRLAVPPPAGAAAAASASTPAVAAPGAARSPVADALAAVTDWPTLDLQVDALQWHGRPLGRVELEGRPVDTAGAPRDWLLQRLAWQSEDGRLAASGRWSAARRQMALEGRLDVADAGDVLEALGGGRQVRGGRGHVQGQFAWTGAPLWPDWPTLDGRGQVSLEAGRFLKAEPGAARLLGVLSLQALPRRLTLDFRDVFQQGFAFDQLAGDVALSRGVARTNNLRIRGVQAAVLIEGEADLQHETQDLHMVIVPEINAGTASLAYAAINPAVGLGTFLAQLFLRKPLMQAGTRELQVTGPWADPQVQTLERRADAPLPDFEGAPAAAASAPQSTP